MKFEGRWVYCEICQSRSIKCEFCDNLSCTGSSCEKCKEEFKEADRMCENGEAPDEKDIPFHPDCMKLHLLLAKEFDRLGKEYTEEEWDNAFKILYNEAAIKRTSKIDIEKMGMFD